MNTRVEKINRRDLVGKMVTVKVAAGAAVVEMRGTKPLRETMSGQMGQISMMPGGLVGILIVGGEKYAFDASLDIKSGKIEIILEE